MFESVFTNLMKIIFILTLVWATLECSKILAGRKGIAKYDIEEGKTLTLTCKADPTHLRTYRWVYIRETQNPIVRVLSSGRRLVVGEPRFSVKAERKGDHIDIILKLKEIRPYETGLFMCWKQNKKPDPQVYVRVLEKGVTEVEPKSVEISGPNYSSFGNPARIKCIIRPQFSGKVIWTVNGVEIFDGDHSYKQLTSVSDTGEVLASLEVTTAREDGNYTCKTDTDSPISASFHLIVRVAKVESLVIEPQNDKIHYGDSVTLTCIVSGTREEILWMRDRSFIPSNETEDNMTERRSTLEGGNKKSELIIRSFSLEDNGQYVCYVTGDSKYLLINIEGRPSRLIGDISWQYLPGRVLQFSCNIQYTKGKKVVSWLFEDAELPEAWYFREITHEDYKNITNFRLDISVLPGPDTLIDYIGVYTCSTPFANTSTSIFELVPLMIGDSPPEMVELMEGQTFSLNCSIFGYIEPIVYWEMLIDDNWKIVEEITKGVSKETINIKIISTVYDFENNTMGVHQELRFRNILPRHSGEYHCMGNNQRDSVMLSTQVNVIALPPQVVGMTAEEISEGDDLIITCSVENWNESFQVQFKNEFTIINSDVNAKYSIAESAIKTDVETHSNSSNLKTFILTISSATIDDQGMYECQVGNESSDSVKATVNMKTPVIEISASPAFENSELLITCSIKNMPLDEEVIFTREDEILNYSEDDRLSVEVADIVGEKSSKEQMVTNEAMNDYVLKIQNLRLTDSGVYHCMLGPNYKDIMATIHIDVKASPPDIIEIASSPAFQKGQLFISCTISNMPIDEEVIFTRGNDNLNYSEDDRLSIHVAEVVGERSINKQIIANQATYVLKIQDLRLTDSGAYHCMLGPKYDDVSATVYIDVEEADDEDILLGIYSSKNGKDLILNCTVIKWNGEVSFFHNETLLLEEDDRFKLTKKIHETSTSHLLETTGWSDKDAGRYQCFTTPFAYTDINITSAEIAEMFPKTPVLNFLDFKQLIELPTEKTTPKLSLQCLAPGEPEETIFTHNGIIFAQSDAKIGDIVHSRATLIHLEAQDGFDSGLQLTLNAIDSEDLGYWHCISRYPDSYTVLNASLTVEIYVPAKFMEVPDREIKVLPGSKVELNCAASGLPVVQIDWFRKNISGVMQSGKEHAKLEIANFSTDDEGTYLCRATNEYELLEYETILSVDKSLRIIDMPPPEVIVNYGDDIDLTCISTGSISPTVNWFKGEDEQMALMTGKDFVTLSVNNISVTDLGVYTCKATILELHLFVKQSTRLVLHMESSVLPTTSNAPTLLMGRLVHLNGPHHVEVGSNFTISCLVSPLLDLYVAVIVYNDLIITVGESIYSSDPRISITTGYGGMGERVYMLTVRSAQKTDSGLYECQVNTEPLARHVHHISVVDEGVLPPFISTTEDLHLGTSGLTRPFTTPTSITDGVIPMEDWITLEPTLTDKILKLDIEKDDSNEVILSTVDTTEDVIPVIIERIGPIFASIGDTVKIPCTTTLLEMPIIWFEERRQRLLFVDELDVGQNPRITLEESLKEEINGKTKTLVIEKLQTEDSGNYSCSVPHNTTTTTNIEIIIINLSELIPTGDFNAINDDETSKSEMETATEEYHHFESTAEPFELDVEDDDYISLDLTESNGFATKNEDQSSEVIDTTERSHLAESFEAKNDKDETYRDNAKYSENEIDSSEDDEDINKIIEDNIIDVTDEETNTSTLHQESRENGITGGNEINTAEVGSDEIYSGEDDSKENESNEDDSGENRSNEENKYYFEDTDTELKYHTTEKEFILNDNITIIDKTEDTIDDYQFKERDSAEISNSGEIYHISEESLDMTNSSESSPAIDDQSTKLAMHSIDLTTIHSTSEVYFQNVIEVSGTSLNSIAAPTEVSSTISYNKSDVIESSTNLQPPPGPTTEDYVISISGEIPIEKYEQSVFIATPGEDIVISEEMEVRMTCPTKAVTEDITWKSDDKLLFLGSLDLAGVDGIQLMPSGQLRLLTGSPELKNSVSYTCFVYNYEKYEDVEVMSYHVDLLNKVGASRKAIPFYGTNWYSAFVAPSSKYSSQILSELLQEKGLITRPIDITNCSIPEYVEGWEEAQTVLKDCLIELNEITNNQTVFVVLDILATIPFGGKYATSLIYVNNKVENISTHIYGALSPLILKKGLIDIQCGTPIYENELKDDNIKDICKDNMEKSISVLWEAYKSQRKPDTY